ncbi:hypothetical protein SEA_DELTON_37 [Mycobacterium phage Delton]|uniref:Uncharacterized protein n=1 Tax=Mycobacterium phage Delton TaxID=2530186 RepID=A0A481W7M1_9CAUD|nr:hypothetical protein SEA_DELTON_37 [Mycobacterium phage Delton]
MQRNAHPRPPLHRRLGAVAMVLVLVLTCVSCPQAESSADGNDQHHSQLCRDEEYAKKHAVECGRVQSGPISITPPTGGHGGGAPRRGLIGRILDKVGLGGLL